MEEHDFGVPVLFPVCRQGRHDIASCRCRRGHGGREHSSETAWITTANNERNEQKFRITRKKSRVQMSCLSTRDHITCGFKFLTHYMVVYNLNSSSFNSKGSETWRVWPFLTSFYRYVGNGLKASPVWFLLVHQLSATWSKYQFPTDETELEFDDPRVWVAYPWTKLL